MDVFKQTYTVWTKDGERVPAGTEGAEKTTHESGKWYGKIKTPKGWQAVPLATDKSVSRKMLARLVGQAEGEAAGIIDPLAKFKDEDPRDYLPPFLLHMREAGDGETHIKGTGRQINAVLDGAGIKTLAGLEGGYENVSDFLTGLKASPRTKNTYRQAMVSFGKFLTKERKRIKTNPFLEIPSRPTPKATAVRRRRAITAEQLRHLIDTVQKRPLENVLNAACLRKSRPSSREAYIDDDYRGLLLRKGRERSLLYAFAAATGFRESEISALKVRNVHLGSAPCVRLSGKETKNGKDACIPLASDLATALGSWIADTERGPDDRLFRVAGFCSLMRAWRKDLRAAGIPYRDAEGRVFDFHSLRKCLGTYLRMANIDPATSMKMMRHSDIRLTMEIYNDDTLLEMAPVAAMLPKFI